jgi:TPR repeat protein
VAVARAAINWRRAGMPAGLDDAQLRKLAEIALDELDPGAAFTQDTYAVALRWAKGRDPASDPRWHGIALLRPVPESRETLWRDFDAVTTWVTEDPNPDPPLSHATWAVILDHVTPETAIPVGTAANRAGELEVAITSHRVAADNPDAMFNLGVLLQLRAGEGDLAEAEQLWRRAATDHDHPGAMTDLGILLQVHRGDGALAEAEQWIRRAATDHDYPDAMINLAILLEQRRGEGDLAEAEQWYRRAATVYDDAPFRAYAMTALGTLLWERGGEGALVEAEQWYRRAATVYDHGSAMTKLADLLQQRGGEGDLAEAEQWLERARRPRP